MPPTTPRPSLESIFGNTPQGTPRPSLDAIFSGKAPVTPPPQPTGMDPFSSVSNFAKGVLNPDLVAGKPEGNPFPNPLQQVAKDYGSNVKDQIVGNVKEAGRVLHEGAINKDQNKIASLLEAGGDVGKATMAPTVVPFQMAMKAVSDKLSSIPAVQKLATSQGGDAVANLEQKVKEEYDKISQNHPDLVRGTEGAINIVLALLNAKASLDTFGGFAPSEGSSALTKAISQSTSEMEPMYREALPDVKFDGSQVLPKQLTDHVVEDVARKFESVYNMPEQAKNIRTALSGKDFSSLGDIEKAVTDASGVNKGLPMGESGLSVLYKAITSKSPEQIDAYVAGKFEKGVKPSVAGKNTTSQVGSYQNKVLQAVKTIADNKSNLNLVDEYGEPTGKLPQNLKQFADAIDQTKKQVFSKYDALQKAAGENGAKVELVPISNELRLIQNSPVIEDLHPEVAKYAESKANALEKRGSYTTEQTQDAISNLNKSLEAFYKNPSYETASRASIDAMIANQLRSTLDGVIENSNVSDASYQALKNQYGALRSIEKDVVHRSIVDARKNIKGLIDFSDIATGAEVLKGLATLNPATIATGLTGKAIAAYYKYLNNPNTAIKQLFNQLEKGGLSAPNPLVPEVKESMPSSPNTTTEPNKMQGKPNPQSGTIKNPFSGGNTTKVGTGEFGDIYEGAKGQDAVEFLLKNKSGEVREAFTRPDIGKIDLVYGKPGEEGYGLAHILEKHSEAINEIDNIIENGTPLKQAPDRYLIVLEEGGKNKVAAVKLDWNGKSKTWIVSSFIK